MMKMTATEALRATDRVFTAARARLAEQFGDDPRLSESKLLEDLALGLRVLDSLASRLVNTAAGDEYGFEHDEIPRR